MSIAVIGARNHGTMCGKGEARIDNALSSTERLGSSWRVKAWQKHPS